jgi:hypothetical protein
MKKILTYFALMAAAVSCNLYGEPEESLKADVSAGVEVTISDVKDSSFVVTVAPKAEVSFYSYLVSTTKATLDPSNLYAVKYKDLAQGCVQWTSETQSKVITMKNLMPNTKYYVYAVAGSKQGNLSEVVVAETQTSDALVPTLASFKGTDSTMVLTYSENIAKAENCSVTARYFGINTAEIKTNKELGTAETVDVVVSGKTVTVNFKNLPDGAYYSVDVAAGSFTDLAGNPVAGVQSGFTTNAKDQVVPVGVYGRKDVATFALAKMEDKSYSDAKKLFTVKTASHAIAAADSKLSGKASIISDGKVIALDMVYKTHYILSKVDGAVAVRFQVPEAPDFGNNVKVEFPEGAFIDIYGNASEAWSQTVLFAYDYKLEDIYGYFVGNATSLINGDGLTMIATEASDDAEKGNVKITNFMTWPCTMYANFDPQAGTLTIEDWQLVYKPNETMALMFATNSDAGEPLVLHMYKKGVLSAPSIWAGLYLDAGADSGWYDIFSDMTLNWQAEDPMGGGVAPAAAKTLAPVKVGPKKF